LNRWQVIVLFGLIWGVLSACSNIIQVVPFEANPITTPIVDTTALTSTITLQHQLPTRIQASAIQLDALVVKMGWSVKNQWGQAITDWDIPYHEAGWHQNSAVPGVGNNIVISGHNNSMGGRVFANVENLAIGDTVTLFNARQDRFEYQITERNIVRSVMASAETLAYLHQVMRPTSTEQLTLITCWPSWSNTHRLIIIAEPLSSRN